MIVVSDTSPLCNLALVNHIWLRREIYGVVIIPDVVANELAAARDLTIQNICTLEWIERRSLTNPSFAQQLQNDRGLDPGQAWAIAYSNSHSHEVLQKGCHSRPRLLGGNRSLPPR